MACHAADLTAFVPWVAAGRPAGRVHRDRLPLLLGDVGAFEDTAHGPQLRGADAAARSDSLAALVAGLHRAGALAAPLDEPYPLLDRTTGDELAQLDRIAVPWLGAVACGVHLNGYVRTASGLRLWIARRSSDRRTYPGHLDNLVAGGQRAGGSAQATLVRECAEEAGIPGQLAARAVPVGVIAYRRQDGLSLHDDRLACFDLELPAAFEPRPIDGEVQAFAAWPAAEVAASLRDGDPWKPNCALVVLDFLLRHGLLDGELDAAARYRLWQAVRGG